MDSPARVGRLRLRLADRLSLGAKSVWLLVALAFAPVIAIHPEPTWLPTFTTALGIFVFGGFLAMSASWLMSLWSRDRSGHVTFHDGVLRLERNGRAIALPASEITSAFAIQGVVEIETRAGERWIVEPDENAEELVDALGRTPGGKPVTYGFAGRHRRFLHFLMAFLAYQSGILLGMIPAIFLSVLFKSVGFFTLPSLAIAFAGMYALFKRLSAAPVVTVGNDGVWIQTGFRKRFVPIGEIVMAHQAAVGGPIRLKLRDGGIVPIAGFLVDSRKRDAAAVHIRTLLAKHAELQKSSVTLTREGRTVRDWREHLRQMVEGAGYRIAGTSESLVDLVSAPGVTREERVGAALALRVSSKDNIPRIRIAAEQCVDPKTRIALEAAALDEIDEAAIEKALR